MDPSWISDVDLDGRDSVTLSTSLMLSFLAAGRSYIMGFALSLPSLCVKHKSPSSALASFPEAFSIPQVIMQFSQILTLLGSCSLLVSSAPIQATKVGGLPCLAWRGS
jgi:hypothetical protein